MSVVGETEASEGKNEESSSSLGVTSGGSWRLMARKEVKYAIFAADLAVLSIDLFNDAFDRAVAGSGNSVPLTTKSSSEGEGSSTSTSVGVSEAGESGAGESDWTWSLKSIDWVRFLRLPKGSDAGIPRKCLHRSGWQSSDTIVFPPC